MDTPIHRFTPQHFGSVILVKVQPHFVTVGTELIYSLDHIAYRFKKLVTTSYMRIQIGERKKNPQEDILGIF
jgi:hypothetical protein